MRWSRAVAGFGAILTALAVSALGGCGGGDAVIFVTVSGEPMVRDVDVLLVDVHYGVEVTSADLDVQQGQTLPQTFTITPNDKTGDVTITISALDSAGIETARGEQTVTIPTNGRTNVDFQLLANDRVLNTMIVSAQTLSVTATQTGKQLARGPDGNLVAVWENFCPASRCDILARTFDDDLVGIENATTLNDGDFLVNQTPEFTTTPTITAGPSGYAVAWRTTADVKVTTLGPNGAHGGADAIVTTGTTFEGVPTLAARPSGWWVSWEQARADGSREIRARRLTAAGTVDGADTLVSPGTDTHGAVHAATMANGQTVFAWSTTAGATSSLNARVYEDGGAAATGVAELAVEAGDVEPGGPTVVPVGAGFLLVYRVGPDFVGRMFGADAAATGGVTPISDTPVAPGAAPAVALRDDGVLAVAWQGCDEASGDLSCDIHLRLLDAATLTPRGPSRVVNTTRTGDQTGPSVAAVTGGFALAWTDTSARAPDTDDDSIRGIVAYDTASE